MIILDTPSKSIQVYLGMAATNQLNWVTSYVDLHQPAYAPQTNQGNINDTTAVTIISAPALNAQRQVKYMSIYNADIGSQLVTIVLSQSGVNQILVSVNVPTGNTLVYHTERGWELFPYNTVNFPITVPQGGTGSTSFSPYALIAAGTTAQNPFQQIWPLGNSYQILTSQGANALPVWANAPTGGTGTVTSVGLQENSSVPIYNISGSPITTSGTLGFTLKTQNSHTLLMGPTADPAQQPTFRTLQATDIIHPNSAGFLNNDGNGNMSWVPLQKSEDYFFIDTASDIATYKQMTTTDVSTGFTLTTAGVTDTQILQNWATNANVPNTQTIPEGLYSVNIHAAQTVVGGKTVQLYCDVVECNNTGTDIAIIGTTGYSIALTSSNTDLFVTFVLSNAYVMASSTSRIVARIRAHVTGGGSAPTVVIYYGGTSDSHLTVPATTSFGGIVTPSLGGTGQDTSASTGVAQVNSGTWSVSTALANGTTATKQSQNDDSIKVATTSYVDEGANLQVKLLNSLGSSVISQSLFMNPERINTSILKSSGVLVLQAIYLNYPTTLTGVKYYMAVAGSFTANNYNGVCLYSYSAGTLTLVASSTNDATGALWKITSNTYGSKAFTGTYSAAAGVYYVGFMYNQSAQVTAPQWGGMTTFLNTAVSGVDLTNSAFLIGNISATSLPSPQAASGISLSAGAVWLALY